MGETNSYAVQGTENPEPTLEDAAKAIDENEAKAVEAEANKEPYTYNKEEEARPEWLPEKFESAEAMAKAYSELEGKLGQTPTNETTEEAPEVPESQEDAVTLATQEFQEKGELSAETYETLSKAGLNKMMVDNYIAGQQAIINQTQMEITNEIGGMQEYQKLSNWAAETLSDEDLEAYNATVENGTTSQAKFAIKSLYSQFKAAGSPKIAQGDVNGTGVPPFQSRAQVTAAMSDRRYDSDPAYRDEVLKRLARSNV